eukprot:TRINITY_DN479_c4_g1_i3.p1 TRINITY_DN479_c4_g1~~TRINITY_DN479_c4_g1_i3.p1  ORF type:complete len:305 (+),score=51.99 TRINITY_DN479_c4_g1_i3:85-915(+)
MLHSVFSEPTSHARHHFRLRHYAVSDVAHFAHHPAPSPLPSADSRFLNRARPRGDDGRFVPRADEHHDADSRNRKVCGWCGRTQTSQWRVGPTSGSLEMGTLCNACGINYRRALQKAPNGALDLDQLAHQQGTRLSIQKALKRQRKLSPSAVLSPAPTQFKRSRPTERRQSSVSMLLSRDTSPPPPARASSSSSAWQPIVTGGVHVPLSCGTLPPPPPPPPPLPSMQSYGALSSRTAAPFPMASSPLSRGLRGATHGANDRLPPFRSFIGNLPSCE